MRPSALSASGRSSTSTKSRPCESERGGAGDAAVQALEGDGATSAGQADAVRHLGDGADLRVLVVVLGHEQHALLVADVDGEGDVHVGEDDDVFQGDEQQADRVLVLALAHGSRFRTNVIVGSETVPTAAQGCVEARQEGSQGDASSRSALIRRNRCSDAAATRPASRSDDVETPHGRYVMTPATKTPPSQKTSPVSWRAAEIQPALCSTSTLRSRPTNVSSFGWSRTCAVSQRR